MTNEEIYYPSATLTRGAVTAGFSTRHGGDDPSALARAAGFDEQRLLTLTQVHGDRVLRVRGGDDPERVRTTRADALVTDDPDLFLAVKTADCVPVLLAHVREPVVAAAHAGWRGLVAGVIEATVREVADLAGAPRSELVAALGPAIGPCCFEVGPDVAETVARAVGSREVILQRRPRPHVDLWGATLRRLIEAGIPRDRVELVGPCTRCAEAAFHSYRREGPGCGRQLSFIGIRPGAGGQET